MAGGGRVLIRIVPASIALHRSRCSFRQADRTISSTVPLVVRARFTTSLVARPEAMDTTAPTEAPLRVNVALRAPRVIRCPNELNVAIAMHMLPAVWPPPRFIAFKVSSQVHVHLTYGALPSIAVLLGPAAPDDRR